MTLTSESSAIFESQTALALFVHLLCLEQHPQQTEQFGLNSLVEIGLRHECIQTIGYVGLEQQQHELIGRVMRRLDQSAQQIEHVILKEHIAAAVGQKRDHGLQLADLDLLLRVVLDESEEGAAQISHVLVVDRVLGKLAARVDGIQIVNVAHVGLIGVLSSTATATAKVSLDNVEKELNAVLFAKVLLVVLDNGGHVLDVADANLVLGLVPDAKVEYEMLVDEVEQALVADQARLGHKLLRHPQQVDVHELLG